MLRFLRVNTVNKEWSEQNKTMQGRLKKKETFSSGIETLFQLRKELMQQMTLFKNELSVQDFSAMPYPNAKGYHSKTIAYSLWHIFRIEDIAAHTLIADDEQVFFKNDHQRRIGSPIITTGNELCGKEISEFSEMLSVAALYDYICEVYHSTEDLLKKLSFEDMKTKVSAPKRDALEALKVVSSDENANWLIEYWCTKDIRGLIQMPFSRHWIMHTEACLRIRDKLIK